jgi:hypothetical protein
VLSRPIYGYPSLMARRQPYLGIGYLLGRVIEAGGGLAAVTLYLSSLPAGRQHAPAGPAIGIAILYAAVMAAVVVHELGHYLAVRLLKGRATAIHNGTPPALVRFRRGKVRFELGLTPRGRVMWTGQLSAGRAAVIALAGSLANLIMAAVALVLPIYSALRYSFAVILVAVGLASLMPMRARNGRLSDGARLLQAPARSRAERDVRRLLEDPAWRSRPEAADILRRGCQLEVPAAVARWHLAIDLLGEQGRTQAMLRLHRELPSSLPAAPPRNVVLAVHHAEWVAATLPGLPLADANLASTRMAWVLKHSSGTDRIGAKHTLALVRLRQGSPAAVEPLCADALAADLEPGPRAEVLATVAMARHAAGHSGRAALDEAMALDPSSRVVAEAMARLDDASPAKGQPRARKAGSPHS